MSLSFITFSCNSSLHRLQWCSVAGGCLSLSLPLTLALSVSFSRYVSLIISMVTVVLFLFFFLVHFRFPLLFFSSPLVSTRVRKRMSILPATILAFFVLLQLCTSCHMQHQTFSSSLQLFGIKRLLKRRERSTQRRKSRATEARTGTLRHAQRG